MNKHLRKLDDQFRAWVRTQPSCISGLFSEYVHGEGRCIAAHIRRAGKSGTAYKPPFSALPLTDTEHKLTHQHGESFFHPKAWWDEQVEAHLERWIRAAGIEGEALAQVREALGVSGA